MIGKTKAHTVEVCAFAVPNGTEVYEKGENECKSGRRKTENNEILLRVWWEKKNEKKRRGVSRLSSISIPGKSERNIEIK